jgi:hypothetical protein
MNHLCNICREHRDRGIGRRHRLNPTGQAVTMKPSSRIQPEYNLGKPKMITNENESHPSENKSGEVRRSERPFAGIAG